MKLQKPGYSEDLGQEGKWLLQNYIFGGKNLIGRKTILAGVIFSVPSIISLIYHGYLGSFTRLIADDFCSISTIQRIGYLRSIRYWYFSWNGRYANSLVDGVLNILGSNQVSYVVPFILLIWTVITIYAVAWSLPASLDGSEKSRLAISIGALSIFCILLLIPNVQQSLYWWGGMRAYSLPLVFLSLYIFIYQFFSQWEQALFNLRRGIYLISFMLAFFIAGFNETLSPVLGIFIASLVILGLASNCVRFKSPAFYFLMAGLLGAFAGLFVLVVAPGNAVRQEVFRRSTILGAFQIALNSYRLFLRSWIGGLENILGLCALGLGGIWAGLHVQPSGKYPIWRSLILFLFCFVLAYSCFLPAAYSMSTLPPDRALITPVYFLINGILVASYFLGQELRRRFGHILNIKRGIGIVFFVLLAVASFLNISDLHSSRMVYVQYAQQWDEMDTYIHIEKNKGKEKVRLLAKQNWAGLAEPKNRPGFWLNVCMSDYYGIQVLAPDPDQP